MTHTYARCLVAMSAIALLAGCATSGGGSSQSAQKRLQPANYEVDGERVALIEYVARKRGVEVHWVNKPRRLAEEAR